MSVKIFVLVPSVVILVTLSILSVKIMYNSHRLHTKTMVCGLSDLYQSFKRRDSDDGGGTFLLKDDSYLPYYITLLLWKTTVIHRLKNLSSQKEKVMFNENQQASFKTINEHNNMSRNFCALDKIVRYKVMSIQQLELKSALKGSLVYVIATFLQLEFWAPSAQINKRYIDVDLRLAFWQVLVGRLQKSPRCLCTAVSSETVWIRKCVVLGNFKVSW
jgi:hypothetical protein